MGIVPHAIPMSFALPNCLALFRQMHVNRLLDQRGTMFAQKSQQLKEGNNEKKYRDFAKDT